MAKLVLVDLNLNKNELQNAVFQNLASAPSSPKAGQFYFSTTDSTLYVYDGTSWVNALSQGDYTFQNGIEEVEGRAVQLKFATGDNAGNVVFTANANGLKGDVDLSGKVDKNDAITGATKCKITYDAKGLVTAGADLEASDIPNLSLSKITDVTATAAEVNVLDGITASTEELNILDGVTADATEINVLDGIEATTAELNIMHGVTASTAELNVLDGITASTAELNIMDGVTVTAADINTIPDKIELTDLSVASTSANYLEYNNATGEFGAKVDTTVTAASTNLVTSGAVESAISAAIVGGVTYKGTWTITGQTDYSGITLPVKKGYLYYVAGTGPVTIGGIEWNAGDYLLVNDDVAAGGSLVGKVEKIDNTEAADIVRLNATQTLTNKTIDADDNTISNLETDNFKSGVIQTTVRGTASASDTALASEKAVASAIEDFITASSTDTLTNKTIDANGTGNSITNLEVADFASGVVQTTVRAVASASDSALASEKAVATALAAKANKLTAQNTALTPASGICTWTISNTLGTADVVVKVYEVSTGAEVITDVAVSASNVVVKMNASDTIVADTYKAVIIGC